MSRWSPIESHWGLETLRASVDAKEACERAADITGDDVLTAVFREAALVHGRHERQLSSLLVVNGAASPQRGTANGRLRRLYLRVVGNLKSDEDTFLLEQVLRFERRLRECVLEARSRIDSAQLAPLLRDQARELAELERCFEERYARARVSA